VCHDVEFRRGTYGLPWDPKRQVQTAEVVIDGISLKERFTAVGSTGVAIPVGEEVAADLAIWGPDALEESDAPEGFCPCSHLRLHRLWVRRELRANQLRRRHRRVE
jgi:hypothetical protein